MTEPADKENPEKPAALPAENAVVPLADQSKPTERLTPEEQMAQFEKELKEQDWGHQPC
ncbi:MAG TPA: hypothetical protein VL200_04035 [Lacunisphaera sp.]|jgi:hypothetical protein|nr:hypothetical protein [Lacunisphaera sp.]